MEPLTDEIRDRVAFLMGMKPAEIITVVEDGADLVVQTHDGRWTLIRDDGSMVFGVDAPVEEPEWADEPVEDEVDPDAIPDKVADVLAWVGDDAEKAQRALDAEQAKERPRSTLVEALTKLLQPAGPAE